MTEPRPVSRRRVLHTLGAAGATLLVAGVGVGGYRLFDTKTLDPGSGQAYDPWQHWQDTAGPVGAVAAAILAANPHNTQPWLFEVGDTAVDLLVDVERQIGSVDPYRREQHVGLGCALENLVLACRARGLRPRLTLLPDGPLAARVAHVELTPTAPQVREARPSPRRRLDTVCRAALPLSAVTTLLATVSRS